MLGRRKPTPRAAHRSAPLTDRADASARPRRTLARALLTSTYIPTFLAEIGIGAMLPVLALSLLDLGQTAVVASLGVAAYSLGRIPGSAWGGRLAGRLGPARAAVLALVALGIGSLTCWLAPVAAVFLAGAVLLGLGHAAFHVARQAQIDEFVTTRTRARALTTLAGTWRIANFVGPVVGAVVISVAGLAATYVFAAVTIVLAMVALQSSTAWRTRHHHSADSAVSLGAVLRGSVGVLRTLGVAVLLTGAVRAARLVVIPLWATHLGLSEEIATLIFGISAAADMLLFYPAGAVMDRWGRAWTAVPSTLMIACGTIALPFTGGALGLTGAAVLIGIGNGWGSGVLMTLGADAAPARGRSEFIGTWMVLQDVGSLLGPLLVSGGAAIALPMGFFAVGGVGVGTAGALAAWIPPWRLQGDP